MNRDLMLDSGPGFAVNSASVKGPKIMLRHERNERVLRCARHDARCDRASQSATKRRQLIANCMFTKWPLLVSTHNPNHLGYSIRGAPRLAVRRKSGQHQSKRRSIDIERDEAKVGLPSTGNDRWWLQKYLNICSSSSAIKTDVYNYILYNMMYFYLHIVNPYIYILSNVSTSGIFSYHFWRSPKNWNTPTPTSSTIERSATSSAWFFGAFLLQK